MSRVFVECPSPGCYNCFFVSEERANGEQLVFCRECRQEHSYHVLMTQVEHDYPIRTVLHDARIFGTASGMGDFVGVSFVTIYHWIKKYFGMTFQEFRREHICNSDSCYLLDISGSPYSRGDYILKKLKDRRFCACINELGKDHMLTNAPPDVVEAVLQTKPKLANIVYRPDKVRPIYAKVSVKPIYWEKLPYPIYV